MSTKKCIFFKGVSLQPGDVIKVTPAEKRLNPRDIEMAVIDSLNIEGTSLLVLLNHADALRAKSPMMELKESEVDHIEVVMEAAQAVPHHSEPKRFRPSERVIFRKGDQGSGGKVIAAFDSFVAAELNLGDMEAADVVHFDRPPTGSIFAPPPAEETDVPLWRT